MEFLFKSMKLVQIAAYLIIVFGAYQIHRRRRSDATMTLIIGSGLMFLGTLSNYLMYNAFRKLLLRDLDSIKMMTTLAQASYIVEVIGYIMLGVGLVLLAQKLTEPDNKPATFR